MLIVFVLALTIESREKAINSIKQIDTPSFFVAGPTGFLIPLPLTNIKNSIIKSDNVKKTPSVQLPLVPSIIL